MHSRRELAGRFWPDVLDESARATLRTALYTVRQLVGDALVSTREQVGLPQGVREGDDPARGELLEGFDDEWVHAARERQRGEAPALALPAALARRHASPR